MELITIQEKIFGEEASTLKNRKILKSTISNYQHINLDITSDKIKDIFEKYRNQIKLVIHTAAQPHMTGQQLTQKLILM